MLSYCVHVYQEVSWYVKGNECCESMNVRGYQVLSYCVHVYQEVSLYVKGNECCESMNVRA